jgi:hypothetical protein
MDIKKRNLFKTTISELVVINEIGGGNFIIYPEAAKSTTKDLSFFVFN